MTSKELITDVELYNNVIVYSTYNKINYVNWKTSESRSVELDPNMHISDIHIVNENMYLYDNQSGMLYENNGSQHEVISGTDSKYYNGHLYILNGDSIHNYNISTHKFEDTLELNDSFDEFSYVNEHLVLLQNQHAYVYHNIPIINYQFYTKLLNTRLPLRHLIEDEETLYLVPEYYNEVYRYEKRTEV